ncbi:SpoIID/LytB domain-containing protein [Metabacillus sp. 84]|uniref:SpoIID/LytB domain-containing protein n=1 Tax=Metabacillus sp. 84 TaxID=3404705 RepID=UPI003CF0120C
MKGRAFAGGALLTAALLFGFSPASMAYEKAFYTQETKVKLATKTSLQVQLNGLFELENLSTREKTLLLPESTLTITAGSGSSKITAGTDSYSAANGFRVSELTNLPEKIVKFTSPTTVRSAADDKAASVASVKKIEAAEYTGETTVSGVKWYNVKLANGLQGWVSSKTAAVQSSPTVLSLFKYGSLQYRGGFETKADGSLRNVLGLEEYLKGVVPNEMPASWHMEALKAQAIVARSYAVNTMNLTNTPSSQAYNGYTKEHSRSNKAVDETAGVMVKHNGKPIQSFFYSTSGGQTANAWDVWGSSKTTFPYLKSVEDPYEASSHSNWTDHFASGTILQKFGYNTANTVLYDLKANPKGENGEIGSVTAVTSAGTKTVSGNESVIRKLFPVDRYYGMLRSNWFTLNPVKSFTVQGSGNTVQQQFSVKGASIMGADGKPVSVQNSTVQIQTVSGPVSKEADPATIAVNGKGWGHRIGMSQYGANGFANKGSSAEDIVKHYFPGTVVGK